MIHGCMHVSFQVRTYEGLHVCMYAHVISLVVVSTKSVRCNVCAYMVSTQQESKKPHVVAHIMCACLVAYV